MQAVGKAEVGKGRQCNGRSCQRECARPRYLRARASAAAEPSQPAGSSKGGKFASLPAPLARRMEADPNFLYKLLVEIGIDETTTAVVNTLERGSPLFWTAQQTLQVVSQAFNAALNDIALVWFLAPKTGEDTASKSIPSHAFEPGDFSIGQRIQAVLQKAVLYSFVGACTGILSLVPSYFILNRCLPATSHIARAALGGSMALAISSNIRYNAVNGLEVLLYSRLSDTLAKVGTIVVRFTNIYAGARIFIFIAGLVGW